MGGGREVNVYEFEIAFEMETNPVPITDKRTEFESQEKEFIK